MFSSSRSPLFPNNSLQSILPQATLVSRMAYHNSND